MSNEPTSALTFRRLLTEVARLVGYADYGEDGDGVAAPPIDKHDLDETKRHVNNAIRMFLADGPASGWSFLRPVADVVVWNTTGVNSSNKVTSGGYDPTTGLTTLNVSSDSFYESMEGHTITLTGVDDFVIRTYVSAKQIKVIGDATGAGTAGVTWSITANGNYTLPRTFGGQPEGEITYSAGSNQGMIIEWHSEAGIRQMRENLSNETGDPHLAAVRIMNNDFDERRRWELMLYRTPDSIETVQFPYELHFDYLVDFDEVPPVPFKHDETILAACRAIVERDVEKRQAGDWALYERALRSSIQRDRRNAPKKLGYFGDPGMTDEPTITDFRERIHNRPAVDYTP